MDLCLIGQATGYSDLFVVVLNVACCVLFINVVNEVIKSALLQVSLEVICLVINDSLNRTLLVDFFLIEYQVTLYIDSLCTNWSLQEVICGEFDISKHLGFDFIRKLLDDRYTSYSRRVYN